MGVAAGAARWPYLPSCEPRTLVVGQRSGSYRQKFGPGSVVEFEDSSVGEDFVRVRYRGMLRDAITGTVEAPNIVGVRALLVHALLEQARQFYLNFDFEPSPTDPLHLFLLIKDVPGSH